MDSPILRNLLVLGLLPPDAIEETYHAIKNKLSLIEQLVWKNLLIYFERCWLPNIPR